MVELCCEVSIRNNPSWVLHRSRARVPWCGGSGRTRMRRVVFSRRCIDRMILEDMLAEGGRGGGALVSPYSLSTAY